MLLVCYWNASGMLCFPGHSLASLSRLSSSVSLATPLLSLSPLFLSFPGHSLASLSRLSLICSLPLSPHPSEACSLCG
jgi:hypothetical protein